MDSLPIEVPLNFQKLMSHFQMVPLDYYCLPSVPSIAKFRNLFNNVGLTVNESFYFVVNCFIVQIYIHPCRHSSLCPWAGYLD